MKKPKKQLFRLYDRKHWFRWLLLYGVIAIVLYGGWYYSLSQKYDNKQQYSPTNEIANWQLYTNPDLGYSIKYPPTWYVYKLKEYPYEGYPGIIDQNATIITSSPRFPQFSVGSDTSAQFIYTTITKVDDITQQVRGKQNYMYPSGEKDKVKQVAIGTIQAYKVTQLDDDVEWLIPYDKSEDGIIATIPSLSVKSQKSSIINQILSTFQFIQ